MGTTAPGPDLTIDTEGTSRAGTIGLTGTIGLIANPVSARDIRRVIANASTLQVADRANIVLRALAALGSVGVEKVYAMPDRKGIQSLLGRSLERERQLGRTLPAVDFLDMAVTSSVGDTHRAVEQLAGLGVDAIVVLGGDGTHRAVVSRCDRIPIVGLSTGTNNAYPETRESTVAGLAAGLYATGAVPTEVALAANKVLTVSINDGERTDLALVDVVASTDRYIGARALWRTDSMAELFVTFADPEAVGMSALAGVVHPVGRDEPVGLHLRLGSGQDAGSSTGHDAGSSAGPQRVRAAIGPGMIDEIEVASWQPLPTDQPVPVTERAGTLALDGERELELAAEDRATVTLRANGFPRLDISRIMRWAAEHGAFRTPSTTPPP